MPPAAEHWFRSYHGAPTDPKWISIARRAGPGVTPGMVASIWWALMDHASQATPRGSVASFDVESIADFFGYDETQCNAILVSLRKREMITANNTLAAWEKRQPKREDSSTDRVRKYREQQRLAKGPENGNAVQRDVTQGNARGEESREEKSRGDEQITATDGGSADAPPPAKPARKRKEKPPAWTVVPESWPGPNPAHRKYAADHRLDLNAQVALFRAHEWPANKAKTDPDRAFTGWLIRAAQWGETKKPKDAPVQLNGAGTRLPSVRRPQPERAQQTSAPLGDLADEVLRQVQHA
jgi:hypothetical protein